MSTWFFFVTQLVTKFVQVVFSIVAHYLALLALLTFLTFYYNDMSKKSIFFNSERQGNENEA